ncbi:MAG TPA: pitrilysin family protein, partial [Longimicrobiaceae bacterium]
MNRRLLTLGALLAAVPAAGAAQQFPTTPPQLGPAPAVRPPTPVQRQLANGMKVLYVRQPELPVVSAVMVVRGAGTTQDPATLPGLASFTASMLDEGAGGKTALQIADALDLLGASLGTGATYDAAQANLYVLKKNFGPALGILADVVMRPDFPANEVQRVREERITNLTRARDEPAAIAGNAFQSLVYGPQHPYGRFATIEAARTLDRDRVTAFHHAAYRPENATLVLVG